MNALELLRDLLRHMEWADALVWRAVFASSAASTDEVTKSRLHHSHMVQRAFLNVWQETPHSVNAGSDLDLNQLARWAREFHVSLRDYVATLSESTLDKPVVLPWAKFLTKQLGRDPAATSFGETMTQVSAHSTYHRGQINARLRELGEEPPLTDFIAWVWFGKPEPEWPDATD
ncbi:MAG: DinB family protein [Acidobacteriota bacterium]